MNLSTLPQEVQQHIKRLPQDKQFQDIFSTDKVLDAIQAQGKDNVFESYEWNLFNNMPLKLQKITLKPLTLNKISLLYMLKSPFLDPKKQITEVDVEIAWYVLQNDKILHEQFDKMIKRAHKPFRFGFVKHQHIKTVLEFVFALNFHPLSYISKTSQEKSSSVCFDADFLALLASSVHKLTGFTQDFILNGMSANTVFYYFLQSLRSKGVKVGKKTSVEVMQEMDDRSCELVLDYLISKGKIDSSLKGTYLQEMVSHQLKEN